jgi:hypothetical protein
MDIWAAEFEARRAKIVADVTTQFLDDLSLYKDLLQQTVRQIKNAEACVKAARRRAKVRGLGEPTKK